MARSISEIKRSLTDEFMSNSVIQEKYGFPSGSIFSECFSVVSIENILFYTIAACCHVMEILFDAHKAEVNKLIEKSVVASVPWYHKMALQFQYGDALAFDETTQQYVYEVADAKKQIVKYVAVRDLGSSVQMLVSGEENGLPAKLSDEVLVSFKSYMNRVKIAGVILSVRSMPSDSIKVAAKIFIDPLVIGLDGKLISDGSKPVELAIEEYLRGILYGGTFNKTKLVDAIQRVEGVIDVELSDCLYKTENDVDYLPISGNNYTAVGGSFVAEELSNTLSYVVQG